MISSKQLALLMLMLSVSFATIASALMAGGIPLNDIGFNGMKLSHLIIGTVAAGVSLWFLPQFETKALGATVTCGMLCSLIFTPLAMWGYASYFGTAVPGPVENVLAAAFGIGGVYIIPGIGLAWKSIKNNPWGFFFWIRDGGKGTPPGSDEKGEHQ